MRKVIKSIGDDGASSISHSITPHTHTLAKCRTGGRLSKLLLDYTLLVFLAVTKRRAAELPPPCAAGAPAGWLPVGGHRSFGDPLTAGLRFRIRLSLPAGVSWGPPTCCLLAERGGLVVVGLSVLITLSPAILTVLLYTNMATERDGFSRAAWGTDTRPGAFSRGGVMWIGAGVPSVC